MTKRQTARIIDIVLPPPELEPRRHKKMLRGAWGYMFQSTTHLAGIPGRPAPRAKRKRKKVWMYSKEACDYLGCTLRHLYWLTRNAKLPYFVFTSGPTPRYVFKIEQVNEWLNKYRGKGRQLGLRNLRMVGGTQELKKGG